MNKSINASILEESDFFDIGNRTLIYLDGRRSRWVKEDINKAIGNLIEMEESQEHTNRECMMCYVNEPNTIFQPCGHGGICFDCSIDVMKHGNIECHFCRSVFSILIL
jgi:hypothetical protein